MFFHQLFNKNIPVEGMASLIDTDGRAAPEKLTNLLGYLLHTKAPKYQGTLPHS